MSEEKQERWKQLLRRWGPTLLSMIVIGGIALLLTRTDMLKDIDFRAIRWEYIALMVPVRTLYFALGGLVMATYTAHLGQRLRFDEWFGLSMAATLINSITPMSGGMATRAGYLRARYGFPISHYTALQAATSLMAYFVGGLMGLILLLALALHTRQPIPWLPVGIMAAMAAGPLAVILLPLEKLPLPRSGRLIRWIQIALDGWREIRTSPALLIRQVELTVVMLLTQAVSIDLGLRALGEQAPFVQVLFIGLTTNLVRVTPIASLGLREAIAGVAAQLVSISAARGLAAAALMRVAGWVPLFTLGPIFLYILSRRVPFLNPRMRAHDANPKEGV
jgi:uncharacterized membrane protein YbhN (UPF0104 family)